LEVFITSDSPGGTIRYTTDGSPPGLEDSIYTKAILVQENTVLRANLWTDGFEPGAISTASYILNEPFTLPVVSVSSDPYNLWDDMDGIYVEGSNGQTGRCMDIPVNWNMDWERPLSFEYFDLSGERKIQIDGGTKIHGGCSRTNPMKSLAFFARSKYGNNRIEYPFFSQKEHDSFKGLILRNSGNDFQYTLLRDAMIQAVVCPVMDLDEQAYEPVQVFLNGEYWGIHNLREKVNEYWVESNYDIPVENLDFIKNWGEVFAGNRDGLDSLNAFLWENELVSDANFQQVASWVDLESYTDYLMTQLFFANRDWPGNNQKYWRDRVKGSKWRFILFDLDFTMGIYDFDPSIDMLSFATLPDGEEWPNPAWATLLIRRLLENEGYKDQFVKKYLVHLNTTFEPMRVNHTIDSFYYRLYDIFPAHIERWSRPESMEDWTFFVDGLRLFADERPAYVRQNMRNFFSLGEEVPLAIEAPEHGQVWVNGVRLPANGMQGSYVKDLDLDLVYLPEPGFVLKAWELINKNGADTLALNDPAISVMLEDSTYIRALFEEAEIDPGIQLYINEFMASNQNAHPDDFGEYDDWIELYNAGEEEVDIAGLYLTDDLDRPDRYRIPDGYAGLTTIGPRDHLVLYADKDSLQGPLHLNFKLSSQGESIGLSAKSGDRFLWLDSIRFGPQWPNASFGRFPDGQDQWVAMSPLTPKDNNQVDVTSVEKATLLQWSVFPNPTSDWLHVSLNMDQHPNASPVVLSLWDLTGRRLKEHSIRPGAGTNKLRFDLSDMTPGVYLLVVETDQGRLSKKILKTAR
jgi:hypothetical protein